MAKPSDKKNRKQVSLRHPYQRRRLRRRILQGLARNALTRRSIVSIVTRIFILIAATLLLVASVELFNGMQLTQKRSLELHSDTVQLARIAELDMARILDGSHQLPGTLAKLPVDQGWDKRACTIVEATASSDFEYDHIVGVDQTGIIQCSSSGTALVGAKTPDIDLFNRIVATARFSVG